VPLHAKINAPVCLNALKDGAFPVAFEAGKPSKIPVCFSPNFGGRFREDGGGAVNNRATRTSDLQAVADSKGGAVGRPPPIGSIFFFRKAAFFPCKRPIDRWVHFR